MNIERVHSISRRNDGDVPLRLLRQETLVQAGLIMGSTRPVEALSFVCNGALQVELKE